MCPVPVIGMAAVPVVPAVSVITGPIATDADIEVLSVIGGVIIRQAIVRLISDWIAAPGMSIPIGQIGHAPAAGVGPIEREIVAAMAFPAGAVVDRADIMTQSPR
jgi:hypothetical protein